MLITRPGSGCESSRHGLIFSHAFKRDDRIPLNDTWVNTKDWCKNTFEVVGKLCTNTDNSHYRCDELTLVDRVPCVQTELKTLSTGPQRKKATR